MKVILDYDDVLNECNEEAYKADRTVLIIRFLYSHNRKRHNNEDCYISLLL